MDILEKSYQITLELHHSDIILEPRIIYQTGDIDVYPIEITLTTRRQPFQIPSDAVATFVFRRSNGSVDRIPAEIIDHERGIVLYTIQGTEITLNGEGLATIELATSTQRLAWQWFSFTVQLGLDDVGVNPPESYAIWTAQTSQQLIDLSSRVQTLEEGGVGIEEAPDDGFQYGRQNVDGVNTWTKIIGGSVADHNSLLNRDLPDQHPISSITGLEGRFEDESEARVDAVTQLSAEITEVAEALSLLEEVTQEEVNDINTEISSIKIDMQSETGARKSADILLQDNIDAISEFPEAPNDNKQYARKNESWSEVVLPEGTLNHNELNNRDLSNQHPVSAITGLSNNLSALQTNIDNVEAQIPDITNLATKPELQIESTARLAGDTLLNEALVSEVGRLETDIQSVESAMVTANTQLQTNITAEATTRNAEVVTINGRLAIHDNQLTDIENRMAGMVSAYVFATQQDMWDALEDPDFVSSLVVGTNFYILDVDSPDFWWDGTTARELSTETVDLSNFYTKAEIQALLADKVSSNPTDNILYGRRNNTWEAIPSPTSIVQTTGQSTTSVMSQKAVSDTVAAETTARLNLGLELSQEMTQIATGLEGDIQAESTARANADTILQQNINNVATQIPDISGLATQLALTAEATTRANADTQLQTNIDAKVSFPEAPNDGKQYARKNRSWAEVVSDESISTIIGTTQNPIILNNLETGLYFLMGWPVLRSGDEVDTNDEDFYFWPSDSVNNTPNLYQVTRSRYHDGWALTTDTLTLVNMDGWVNYRSDEYEEWTEGASSYYTTSVDFVKNKYGRSEFNTQWVTENQEAVNRLNNQTVSKNEPRQQIISGPLSTDAGPDLTLAQFRNIAIVNTEPPAGSFLAAGDILLVME